MVRADSPVKSSEPKKESRKPSPYNAFMAVEIGRVKLADPTIDHKEAFKLAARNWKDSPENPKSS